MLLERKREWLKSYNKVVFNEITLEYTYPWYHHKTGFLQPYKYIVCDSSIESMKDYDSYSISESDLIKWNLPDRLLTFTNMEEQIKTYLETHSIKTANTQDPATKKEIEKYYENLNDFNLLNSNLKEETLAEVDRANYSNANWVNEYQEKLRGIFTSYGLKLGLQSQLEQGGFRFDHKSCLGDWRNFTNTILNDNFQKALILAFGDPESLQEMKELREKTSAPLINYLKFCRHVAKLEPTLYVDLIKFNSMWLHKFIRGVSDDLSGTTSNIFMSCSYPRRHSVKYLKFSADGGGKLVLSHSVDRSLELLVSNLSTYWQLVLLNYQSPKPKKKSDEELEEGSEKVKKGEEVGSIISSFIYHYSENNKLVNSKTITKGILECSKILIDYEEKISSSEDIDYDKLINVINKITSHNLDLAETSKIFSQFSVFLAVEKKNKNKLKRFMGPSGSKFIKSMSDTYIEENVELENPFLPRVAQNPTSILLKDGQSHVARKLFRNIIDKIRNSDGSSENQKLEKAFGDLLFMHSMLYRKEVPTKSQTLENILTKSGSSENHTIFHKDDVFSDIPYKVTLNYYKDKGLTLKIVVDTAHKKVTNSFTLSQLLNVEKTKVCKNVFVATKIMPDKVIKRIDGKDVIEIKVFSMTRVKVRKGQELESVELNVTEKNPPKGAINGSQAIMWGLKQKSETTFIYEFVYK